MGRRIDEAGRCWDIARVPTCRGTNQNRQLPPDATSYFYVASVMLKASEH